MTMSFIFDVVDRDDFAVDVVKNGFTCWHTIFGFINEHRVTKHLRDPWLRKAICYGCYLKFSVWLFL